MRARVLIAVAGVSITVAGFAAAVRWQTPVRARVCVES